MVRIPGTQYLSVDTWFAEDSETNLRNLAASSNAPRIFRHFIQGKGQVTVTDDEIIVRYPKRAHNPLLRAVPWNKLPERVSWLGDRRLRLIWQ
jgi:hypothetical protein